MIQNFDFHLHTKYSDGQYTLEKLLEYLKMNQIQYFSITDHDNFSAYEELEHLQLGALKYVTGVEFSCLHHNQYEMHILGYGFDTKNQKMLEAVKWYQDQRIKRMLEIVREVEKRACITISEEQISWLLSRNNPGRPHLARLLVDHQVVKSTEEAFDKYLVGLKSNVNYRLTTKEAFDLIHQAGGKAIWAHPVKVEKKYHVDIREIIDSLIEVGLDGIEIANCLHSYKDVVRYEQLANQKGLLTSGGSDYHGPKVKSEVFIGEIYKSKEEEKIDLERMTFLKEVKINEC